MSFTQDFKGKDNDCGFPVSKFLYQGNTLDGRPWYEADVDFGFWDWLPDFIKKRWSKVYLYYDSNCDGKGGSHPQWGTYYEPPSETRSYDLDNNGKCIKGGQGGFTVIPFGTTPDAGMYSAQPNFDWTPATEDRTMVNCGSDQNNGWEMISSQGTLDGCPRPYPDYTYTWSAWKSTNRSAWTGCGGTMVGAGGTDT